MKIITQGSADRVDGQREVHHIAARTELKEEIDRREKILSGALLPAIGGGTYRPLDRVQDVPQMRRELKNYKKNYERGEPIKLAPVVANELWKKAKRLKDEFVVGMVSKKDMHPVAQKSVVTPNGVVTKLVADYDAMRSTKSIERNNILILFKYGFNERIIGYYYGSTVKKGNKNYTFDD